MRTLILLMALVLGAGAASAGDLTVNPYSIADPQACIEAADRLDRAADRAGTSRVDGPMEHEGNRH